MQRLCRDLAHLGVQALAHLDAAVRDGAAAVEEDADERARLVHGLERERDAELGGEHREAALAIPAARGGSGTWHVCARGELADFFTIYSRAHVPSAEPEQLGAQWRRACFVR